MACLGAAVCLGGEHLPDCSAAVGISLYGFIYSPRPPEPQAFPQPPGTEPLLAL